MKLRHLAVIALSASVLAGPSLAGPALKEIFALGGGAFPQDHIYRIDLSASTVTDLGYSGVGFPTNLAMAPDRTLYYMNPFEAHSLYKATLDGTNTSLVGAPTLVATLPTAGFGIIDGMTVGPDGNLYMTGYGKSEIYKYNLSSGIFSTTVRLVPPSPGEAAGEFRSDLAFDPVTGNLVGIGIKPGSTDRTLFEVPVSIVLSDTTDDYVWNFFGGSGSAWSTKQLDTGTEIGGNPDGLAFDPTNGDLYLSGDGTGIYAYNRLSAARGAMIAGTGDGALNGLGFDLAFQTREAPIPTPEPGTLALLGAALGWAARARRRS